MFPSSTNTPRRGLGTAMCWPALMSDAFTHAASFMGEACFIVRFFGRSTRYGCSAVVRMVRPSSGTMRYVCRTPMNMTLLTRLQTISPVFSSSDCISSPASRSIISGSSYSYEPSERLRLRRRRVSAVTQCPETVSAVEEAYGKTDAVVEVAVKYGATAVPKIVRLVVVALVVVAFVAVRLVAVSVVILTMVAVSASMMPVVKRPKTLKKFVEVAFVVEALVEKKLVDVALVVVAFVAVMLVVVRLARVNAPVTERSPVIVVVASEVSPLAVSEESSGAPVTERECALEMWGWVRSSLSRCSILPTLAAEE